MQPVFFARWRQRELLGSSLSLVRALRGTVCGGPKLLPAIWFATSLRQIPLGACAKIRSRRILVNPLRGPNSRYRGQRKMTTRFDNAVQRAAGGNGALPSMARTCAIAQASLWLSKFAPGEFVNPLRGSNTSRITAQQKGLLAEAFLLGLVETAGIARLIPEPRPRVARNRLRRPKIAPGNFVNPLRGLNTCKFIAQQKSLHKGGFFVALGGDGGN